MDGAADRDSDVGDDSPMSHHDEGEGEGEISEGEPEAEDSSDEGRGTLEHRDLLDRLRLHRPDKSHDDEGDGGEISEGEPETEDATDGRGVTLEQSDLLNRMRQHMPYKGRDDFESLKNSLHPHLSSLASLAQNTPLSSLPQVGGNPLLGPPSAPFSLPMGFPFQHPGPFLAPPAPGAPGPVAGPMNGAQGTAQGGSASSSSSEGSTSSQQTWSFEEQFKQVRQLYEINDDPKRKEFLDDLFSFMQKRGTPINRLPIMAKSVLDLFELYNLVIARGGLVDVINKKLWQEIIKGLHLPSSITSAAFTLRTQYMKYLYPYECEKKNLSTPSELQAAIDGNRREGRRSSYGQFEQQVQSQLNMPSVQRSPVPTSMHQLSQQMSPLSLVTGGPRGLGGGLGGGLTLGPGGLGFHNAAAAQHSAHHMAHDLEQKMMEYMKLFQQKDFRRPGSESPPGAVSPRDAALNALEMSRLTLWSLYNNNASPPTSINNSSPPVNEPQREALNLSESPAPPMICVKRELTEREPPPPAKRAPPPQPPRRSPTPPRPLQQQQQMRSPITAPHHNHHEEHSTNGLGAAFKITSRGDARTGDQQLVVSMELNGVTYEGVLFANPQNNTTSPPNQRHRPMVS